MTEESQVASLTDIISDERRLNERVRALTGEDIILAAEETVGKSFTTTESSVCAVIVKRDSAPGAVRVTGAGAPEPVPNVQTGQDQEAGYDIVIVRPGQVCMFFGNPTVRYVYRNSSG